MLLDKNRSGWINAVGPCNGFGGFPGLPGRELNRRRRCPIEGRFSKGTNLDSGRSMDWAEARVIGSSFIGEM